MAEAATREREMAMVADCAGLDTKIDELRRFVDRRFAELSAEIHASAQLIDFSESNLTTQLGAVKTQLAEVLASPRAGTNNSGSDLEAVVQTTEAAANRIMEAAEAIGDWLQDLGTDPAMRAQINAKVSTIFEACSFQDLTSQRIRRAIEHLHQVEAMLGAIGTPQPEAVPVESLPDIAQDEIDRLLAG